MCKNGDFTCERSVECCQDILRREERGERESRREWREGGGEREREWERERRERGGREERGERK
eukprot:49732-Rhodomonas_salina.2